MNYVKRHFASVMHDILIISLILSMLLIAQQFNMLLYKVGIVLLVISTFLQIGFGNIPAATPFGKSLKFLGIALTIVAIVFVLGILLAPFFIGFTRE